MRMRKLSALAFTAALALGSAETGGGAAVFGKAGGGAPVAGAGAPARQAAGAVYKVDAARSKFMIRAFAGGLLWFKGHDHFVAARDFAGEARLTPGSVSPASLTLGVRAASLAETRDVFNAQQKKIIDGEL